MGPGNVESRCVNTGPGEMPFPCLNDRVRVSALY